MDNKNFFRALFWALLIFLVWQMIAPQIWPPPKRPAATDAPVTTQPADAHTTGMEGRSAPTSRPGAGAPPAGAFEAVGAASAETVVLGDTTGHAKSPYRMRLELSNLGAALETAQLSDHKQRVNTEERYRLLAPIERKDKVWRSLAVEQITIDGAHRVVLDDVAWHVQRREANGAQAADFSIRVANEGAEVIELVRTYTLPAQPAAKQRHDLDVSLTITNLSDDPHRVIVRERGPVGLTSEGRFMPDQKVYGAVRREGLVDLESKTFKELGKKKSYDLYPRDKQAPEPLVWLGGGNLYFTCTICPVGPEGDLEPGYVKEIKGVDLDELAETEDDGTTRLVTRQLELAPHASLTLRGAVYLGPKDRAAFLSPDNADYLARDYMLQITDGYGSCTFTFLTDLMIRLLNWLESVFGNFGVAIIFLVIIVRVILHPVTRKTQVNMVKMQQRMGPLQAKQEEIKKRFAGDNRRIQEETMKLYREEGINPFGQIFTCLPMMLQMPIWIALYSSLRNNVAMRGRGFIWWISDLTTPDCLIPFDKPVTLPLIGELNGFHLLPLLVGVMMFAQQKLMPKAKKATTTPGSSQAQQAEQMQKIMPYMSLVMILLFYKFPSGLNLYIMTSSLIGTAEQMYIRKHIKKQELEAPRQANITPEPKKRRKGPSFFERIQKQAADAQKLRSQRERKEKRH